MFMEEEIKKALATIQSRVYNELKKDEMMLEDKDDYVLTATNTLRLQGKIDAYYLVLDEIRLVSESYGVKL